MPWRGSDGRVFGGSYESWVDRQIREAEERGEFDNLPGAGKPLPSGGADPDWWVKSLIKREQLDMTGALPPQLALRKEAHDLPSEILELPTEAAVRKVVDDFNERVREFWRGPQDGPAVVVRTFDVDELLEQWRSHRARRAAAAAELSSSAKAERPSASGSWLRRLFRRTPSSR